METDSTDPGTVGSTASSAQISVLCLCCDVVCLQQMNRYPWQPQVSCGSMTRSLRSVVGV